MINLLKKTSDLLICSLSWATGVNHSQLLFCHEQTERFSHSRSFVLSDSLTVAHLSWAIWANSSQSLIRSEWSEWMSKFPTLLFTVQWGAVEWWVGVGWADFMFNNLVMWGGIPMWCAHDTEFCGVCVCVVCEERSPGIERRALCLQPTDLIQRIFRVCFQSKLVCIFYIFCLLVCLYMYIV